LSYRRRSTPTKGLPSLRIAATTIKTETTTETTGIATETTETLVAIGYTDSLIGTADLGDVATSAGKRIADYKSIRTRNRQERKRLTKASSITAQIDASTIALRNGSSNTLLSAKKEVTRV
jgi:hypothetical protein